MKNTIEENNAELQVQRCYGNGINILFWNAYIRTMLIRVCEV